MVVRRGSVLATRSHYVRSTFNLISLFISTNFLLISSVSYVTLLAADRADVTAAAEADRQQFRALSATSVSTLLELINGNAGNPAARREVFYALPPATLAQAFFPPFGQDHQRIAVFILDEILAKTPYRQDAGLTRRYLMITLIEIGVFNELLAAKMIERPAGMARQTKLLREANRWIAGVQASQPDRPAALSATTFSNWQALETNAYLAAAHGRLRELAGPPVDLAQKQEEQDSVRRFIAAVRKTAGVDRWWKDATAEERSALTKACAGGPLKTLLPDEPEKQP